MYFFITFVFLIGFLTNITQIARYLFNTFFNVSEGNNVYLWNPENWNVPIISPGQTKTKRETGLGLSISQAICGKPQ
ncbi:hypothetical protein D7Y07_18140 [Bacteroides acidifaciens]|uniref:Uncharacterized protein n=1 Tax=Bacteroides acidifaciens TaxID=85831 RepID=A0A3L7Z1W4_9BACE|nr:hypothetical protein D7Y07_18140 [Bacteroides acidifaciens]